MNAFPFNEKYLSQLPALVELINLGYEYQTPTQVHQERGGQLGNVVLENILRKQLQAINAIHYKGNRHPFSEDNIRAAVQKIKNIPVEGLLQTNEVVYDLLTLGATLEQTIDGHTSSFTLHYIDWENPTANVFHVTAEFPVARMRQTESKTARPDIVLFVNGIPLVIIECKAPDVDVEEGISQTIRNQSEDYIPRLFVYAQVLMSVNKNTARYATVGTERKFWSLWREQEDSDDDVERAINTPLDDDTKAALFSDEFAGARRHFEQLGTRQVTEQDKTIYSLCRPERLLELTRLFTVFDGGKKKIARYQQFFVVRSALARVRHIDDDGRRAGGMIWHTQGSGKSLTMVWLARQLAMDRTIKNQRVVMVTDRVDLDKQIAGVFRQCGIEPARAKSGRQLLKLISDGESVITTTVYKFDKALKAKRAAATDDDHNVFVLVDESHRTQFGMVSARMRQMLPKACYLGFTGTPLTKEQRNNFVRFGGLIEPSYPVRQALEDKAIVPLLYEGRHVEITQDQAAVDLWFERHTAGLSEKQKADLKNKYSRAKTISKAERVVYMHAFDISEHYRATWQGTGFKAQLVAPDKATAVRYHRFLQDIGVVSSEVVISPPDMREGFDVVDDEPTSDVRTFWDKTMRRFGGSEARYVEDVITRFSSAKKPEILVVVDKLLTGFDAPVNTVLYLCRTLREHTLLQAIARVNRLHEGKEFGVIVDYVGILGELDSALTMYDALAGFEEGDLEGVLIAIQKRIEKLPQAHANLLNAFKDIRNHGDEEEYERLLGDEERREEFYGLLTDYAKHLAVALSSHKFLMETDERMLRSYKEDLKRFEKLRQSVAQRYADTVDYREHEPKIKKLLDTHIHADVVTQINKPKSVHAGDIQNEHGESIGEKSAANKYGDRRVSDASHADSIAHKMKRTISENMEQDPAFYEKFSKLIQTTIDEFRRGRLAGADYLKKVSALRDDFDKHTHEDIPESLRRNGNAIAFYGVLQPLLARVVRDGDTHNDLAADTALTIDRILAQHRTVRFWDDPDARNAAVNDIEDHLWDEVNGKGVVTLSEKDIDAIIEHTMRIARNRMRT